MQRFAALFAALMLPSLAWAGDLVVSVRTPAGKPVADAVVMLEARGAAGKGPIRFAWPYRMAQKNMQFAPFVLVVPVGAEVSFPNLDVVLHHVYSFSPAKTFELKLYGHDETRRVRFDKPGVVAVGCNIHDGMAAFVRVVDTPWAAKTDAAGEAIIRDAPEGAAQAVLWHPYLKAARNELSKPAPAGTTRLTFTAELRRPPVRHGGY